MKRLRYVGGYRKPNQISGYEKRIKTLIVITLVIVLIIFTRLFQLQILNHKKYSEIAKEQHFGSIELPTKRGEIFVQDRNSGQLSKLATNTTLNLLYVDPNTDPENPLTPEDRQAIAAALAPLIFTEKDYEDCTKKPKECIYSIEQENSRSFSASELFLRLNPEQENHSQENSPTPENSTPQDSANPTENPPTLSEPIFKPYSAMVKEVEEEILKKISKLQVDFVVLKRDASDELMKKIEERGLPGIDVEKDRFLIHADPTMIPKSQLKFVAKELSVLLNEDRETLERELSQREVRYVFLKNKLPPDISKKIEDLKKAEIQEAKILSKQIKEENLSNETERKKLEEANRLKFRSVVLVPENWRYYPEGDLASHVIGFINRDNLGQYGVEGYFNNELEGESGTIYAESDPFGRQVGIEEGQIINAVHGEDLILTIDRVLQKKVEEVLAEATERYKADSGQVIIMDPSTGAILAMASYPNFNPNEFTKSFTLRKVEPGEEVFPTTPLFKKNERGEYVNVKDEEREDDSFEKFVYENRLGPGALKNPIVSDLYEPGSVFKPLVMAIALDSNEVTPQTTYNDDGPVEVDEFKIDNSDGKHHGITNMIEVLEKSLNTGMIFVSKKLGPKLMYEYLNKFGFGQYAGISLEGEAQGEVKFYSKWTPANLATISFGQGIVATPLQVVTAWGALANGGRLMQPYIVKGIIKEGDVIETEPQVIRRVLSEETSSIITSMLVKVISSSHYVRAYMPGYQLAGKTGTSQIASSKKAGYEDEGPGSVITSFVGYFPAYEPQFVMLVKFDRPRLNVDAWGENTAIPVFRSIAEFLIEQYHIQPS